MRFKISFLIISIIAVLFSISSCDKDDKPNRRREDSRTTLFGKVTEPEENSYSSDRSGEDKVSDYAYAEMDGSGSSGSASNGSWGNGSAIINSEITAGNVTAGVWSDLENWDFWNDLLDNQEYYEDVNTWDLQKIERFSFKVTDNSNLPVYNAEILLISNEIIIWETKTDNKGNAELWASSSENDISAQIKYKGTTYEINRVSKYEDGVNEFQIDEDNETFNNADILFVVDATGSMSDEIEFLKTELNDVIARIKSDNSGIDLRMGSLFYRDEGDEYVTKPFTFTSSTDDLTSFINEQSAGGGGDFPEAVHTALDEALNQMDWRSETRARLLFLLLDAPPHYNQEVVISIESSLIKASEEGIKIIPITASGIDKATEFLMRSFAIITNGTYVFITDDSGIGGEHLEPTIGEYEVEKLNDILVRLVNNNIE